MSWSYSGNPDASPLDKVRFLIQDTDTTDQQLSDQEITAMLNDSGNNAYVAAISCVQALIAKYTRRADKNVGDLHISYSQIAKGYKDLLSQIRQQATIYGGLCTPYAGGISIADKQIDQINPDLVQPSFSKGMNDNPTPLLNPNDKGKDI